MSKKLTKFLPVKNTTTAINSTSHVDGQVLFETDGKHELFVDYAKTASDTPIRHTLIHKNESLDDFSVFISQGSNSGYSALELEAEDSSTSYVEIPHSRYSNGSSSITIIAESANLIFEIPCSANTDWSKVGVFIEPYLISDGGVITSSGSTVNGLCCAVEPLSITYVDSGTTHKIVITYPNFSSDVYGIEIPSGGYITFTCYVRTLSNYGGTKFWS